MDLSEHLYMYLRLTLVAGWASVRAISQNNYMRPSCVFQGCYNKCHRMGALMKQRKFTSTVLQTQI
jgi:hypothetical protein